MFKNRYKIKIVGLNLDRLINYIKNNYKSYNLNRVKYNELWIDLSYNSYYNLLSKIDTSCYNITVEKVYGINKILQVFKQNIALFISAIICFSAIIFLDTKLLKINIYGATETTQTEILNYLKTRSIDVFSNKNISITNLEQKLLENVNGISMVSAVIKGNALLINVKEKLPDIAIDYMDFVAPYNLVIDNMFCYQGTPLKKIGDIVKKGETIIASYNVLENGEKVSVKPIYNVEATTYFTGVSNFKSVEEKQVKTGKKIINSSYKIFGKEFLKRNKKCNYQNYILESKSVTLFNNLFLPIVVNKNIYYEVKQETFNYNFENEKERLLKESLDNAHKEATMGVSIISTTHEIVNIGEYVQVKTYLEAKVNLKND